MNQLEKAVADLRHAYHQLTEGVVKDQSKFADGLIAPAIYRIEQALEAQHHHPVSPELEREIEQALTPGEPVAKAWDEGYRAGINDERMSEANIGIAGFDAKVEPARNNPYRNAPQPQPKQEPMALDDQLARSHSKCIFKAPQPQREWAGLTDDAKYEPIELHVLHSHFAGLLFDFMGWLTSRKERLTLSSADEAGPAVEAITEFGKMRGLMLEDAQVQHWHAILAAPKQHPAWTGLTRVEKMEIIISMTGEDWVYALDAAEAKLREKNT